ncbi:MAG: heavy-metal-associated domain-containing protein [Firmicutes bacterium]|nr:heavy-metal-associated domain-containing protein [Bacillota bacterium]
MQTLVLDISGMSCEHCVRAVTRALQGVAGVKAVEVSLDAQRAIVQCETGASTDAMREAVAEEGYEVTAVRSQSQDG